jgi:hypothetical protein
VFLSGFVRTQKYSTFFCAKDGREEDCTSKFVGNFLDNVPLIEGEEDGSITSNEL